MFRASLLIALLLHDSPAVAPDLSDREIFQRGKEEFQEGLNLRKSSQQARPHFQQAAVYFDELRHRGVGNAALYRNLGNTYLLADDLPRAILSYHRGLRLVPNDLALRDSLAEARSLVVYPASDNLGRPRGDALPPWLPHPRGEVLLIAAFFCYAAASVCLTRWRMTRRGHLLASGLAISMLAATLSALLVLRAVEERNWRKYPLVVIARDGVLLRRGDGLVFPPRYETPLMHGVEARCLFERGDWVQIELSGGEIGWVTHASVLMDAPRS